MIRTRRDWGSLISAVVALAVLLALCNTFREEVSSDQQTKEESKNEQTSAI